MVDGSREELRFRARRSVWNHTSISGRGEGGRVVTPLGLTHFFSGTISTRLKGLILVFVTVQH